MTGVRLSDLLLREGMVTPEQVREALDQQKRAGGTLGEALVTLGFLQEKDIAGLLGREYGVPLIDIAPLDIDPAIIRSISAETARKYRILPLSLSKTTLTVAMTDPSDMFALDDLRFMTGFQITPVTAGPTLIMSGIAKYYGPSRDPVRPQQTLGRESPQSLKELLETPGVAFGGVTGGFSALDGDLDQSDRPVEAQAVVKLIHVVLRDSLTRGAHDIHIEPYEELFRVRHRIDGTLVNIMALPQGLKDPLSSQIKIMAGLDVAEKRLPQEGQIRIRLAAGDRSRDICFRVSCLPTRFGETIALRLLDESSLILDMTKLGFDESSLDCFKRAIARPRGLVLVTGPPRSGKTNTLYSAMVSLRRPALNIVTAEDLVECGLPEISQVQTRGNPGIGLSATLDSLLRQDVDVLMVDEIVDNQAAGAVVRVAGRAGPLLLAAMCDTDTASAVEKLGQMSGQPFLLGRALSLVVAQSLIRRICADCKVETAEPPSSNLIELGIPEDGVGTFTFYRGRGCPACNRTGYRGRTGLYEVMQISKDIRGLIAAGASSAETRRKAVEEGMLTLRMRGVEKVKAGITTVEEVLRQTVL